MPTNPTARDVETARRIAGLCLDYPSNDDPMASCLTVDAPRRLWCNPCLRADAIARALATARAEEREACAKLCEAKAQAWESIAGGTDAADATEAAHALAAAIRAREGAA